MLNLRLLTSSFALDRLSPDVFQHIYPKLLVVDRAHLEMSGSKTLKVRTDLAIEALIEKELTDIQTELDQRPGAENIRTLYDALPIDKSSPRAVYNLLHHSDLLISAPQFKTPAFIDCLCHFNDSVVWMKFGGLYNKIYGYDKDQTAAHEFLEEQVDKGNTWAIEIKFEGLRYEQYGYDKDEAAIHTLLETEVAKGNTWAMPKKFHALLRGKYGYAQDQAAAYRFITSILGIKMLEN